MRRPLTDEEKRLSQRRDAVWWAGMAVFAVAMGLVAWGIFSFFAALVG